MAADRSSPPLADYAYRGARAMVLLHERQMRGFLATWKAAKTAGVALPPTEDPDYASIETLLVHVLSCARGYLVWMCRALGLPDPEIRLPPRAEEAEAEADGYLDHVLERWREPLAGVPEDAFYEPDHPAPWGPRYCIDAMLEHAMLHPLRHRFQLEELLDAQSNG